MTIQQLSPLRLTHFWIKGLHGRRDVNVTFSEDRAVLVGLNGSGKTTILNMLFYFLTRQWEKVAAYKFDEFGITLRDTELRVSRIDIIASLLACSGRPAPRPNRRFPRPSKSFDAWLEIVAALPEEQIRYFLSERVPAIRREGQLSLFDEESTEFLAPRIMEVEDALKNSLSDVVLYLPTYRRIEKDLNLLFPRLDDRHERSSSTWRPPRTRPGHIELVEFGMQDILGLFSQTLRTLGQEGRAELNKLTSEYLRDVIRNSAQEYDAELFQGLAESETDRILERIDESTLNENDKTNLRDAISRIRENTKPSPNDSYIAHYFAKLIDIHKSLSQKEGPVVQMTDVCNAYLRATEKRLVFNDKAYNLQVIDGRGGEIGLADLSSGEKQIVSLFAHLYLSNEKFFVIIDEPELSLSMEWQKRFLADILESGRCRFLLAATHSPFIFEGELDDYAVDMQDCIHEVAP